MLVQVKSAADSALYNSPLALCLLSEMSLSKSKLFEDKFPLVRSCPALDQIRIAEEFTDLIIEVEDGARLQAHRIVLAARIPSLRACLNDPCGKDIPVLSWRSVPLSLATSVLHYVYTGRVEITQSNARVMITFARMVQLPVLEDWGTQFLLNTINVESLPTIWEFARSLNMGKLTDACLRHMKRQFESFVHTDLFVHLPADAVLTLIQSDHLAVSSEEQVFSAISRWTRTSEEAEDEKLRLMHLPAMLKEVQWQQTTAQFRERLLSSHQIFQNSTECAVLLARIINWIAAEDKSTIPCPFNRHIRPPPPAIFVFGKATSQNKWSVLRFDSQMQNGERFADMEARWYASYSAVGESIFVVGGGTTQQAGSTRVDEFLIRERRWRQRAPLAGRRQQHAAAVVRHADAADQQGLEKALIGVFGGCFKEGNTWTYLDSCELYDVSQDRWHKLPDLREKSFSLAAASLPGDDRVFVFGGSTGTDLLTSVAFCQLGPDWQEKVGSASSTEFWLSAARMSTARSGLAVAPFRGRILVAGGSKGGAVTVNVVEMFSPPDAECPLGQWTELAGMNQPRYCFSLLTSGDAVFAMGNYQESANTVETFFAPESSLELNNDLTTWTWSPKRPGETLQGIWGALSVHI